MRKVNIGDKLSLKVQKINATQGKWVRESDVYEMMDNVDIGVVHIATGGRGWSSENYSIALVDPNKNIRLEVLEVDGRVAKCKLLVGKTFKTCNYAARPYQRKKTGITNPQVKRGFTEFQDTFGNQYGVWGYDNLDDPTKPITLWVAFRHLEKRT